MEKGFDRGKNRISLFFVESPDFFSWVSRFSFTRGWQVWYLMVANLRDAMDTHLICSRYLFLPAPPSLTSTCTLCTSTFFQAYIIFLIIGDEFGKYRTGLLMLQVN